MRVVLMAVLVVMGVGMASRATASDGREELIRQVHERFEDPRFADAFWGVLIKSLDSGEVWYERNPTKLFMPASNQKIPTSAAALVTLGPNWKFQTHFTTNGEVRDGILEGDLIVFGNGDPTLYTRFFDDPRTVFRQLATKLKDMGIKRIAGDIIGDDNAFDDTHIGYGWTLGGLPIWYSAEYGALQLNENYIDLTITPPAAPGGPVTVESNLPSSYYTIVNNLRAVRRGRTVVNMDRAVGTNTIVLDGTVVAGTAPIQRSPTITNPTLFYVTVLKEVLENEWIEVGGQPIDCDDIANWRQKPEDFTLVHLHESPPLSEILAGLMKRSQNMYAETMVSAMGWHDAGYGSFDNGRRVVGRVLAQMGVGRNSYRFMDGSGLTRYNYISPRALVTILEFMRRHPYWEVWRDSQPIAGVDGTLRNRMKGTPAEGNARAKTGTIANVRGLSGYVTTADGEELVYSFLVNSFLTTNLATEQVTDGVVAMLAGYSSKPAAPIDGE
ncbi:MAG: D-alanyl-D-alanine carboxypeptidase/D-alanyl-D-alanine-endopeptidase [Candidatus Sumerlaeia bacterium]|nr:D-alanyl-D-alanine carboxypeptidase/D-alanyl-D-alanine-endopeptidase [Candidatus Sumerlaeia bacterium]